MTFATQYNHDRKRSMTFERPNDDESKTQQSDAKDADINIIMAKYVQTGQLPRINSQKAEGGDYTAVTDYRQMLDTLRETREVFDALPAKVRKRFANDPQNMLEFVGNADNKDEAEKLGLLNPPPARNLAEETVTTLQEIRDNINTGENNGYTDDTAKRGKGKRNARPNQGAD